MFYEFLTLYVFHRQSKDAEAKYAKAVEAASTEQKKITDVERRWLRIRKKRADAFLKCFKRKC